MTQRAARRPPMPVVPNPTRNHRYLAALTLAAGCASTATAVATPSDGDRLLDAGDPAGAAALYEIELKARPGDASLAERLRTARRLAAQRHAERAEAAAEKGDLDRAGLELRAAEVYDRDAAPVRKLRAALGSRVAARKDLAEARGRARELLVTDPAAARAELELLRLDHPDDAEIAGLLAEATKVTEADRAAARAAEAWDAGVRRRAVELLASAEGGGRTAATNALRRRMESDLIAESPEASLDDLRAAWEIVQAASLRDGASALVGERLADALAREVGRHRAERRPATAELLAREVAAVDPVHGARRSLTLSRGVTHTHAPRLHFAALDDSARPGDGVRVARALRQRVAVDASRGSAPVVATDEPAPPGAGYPNLTVVGTLRRVRIDGARRTEALDETVRTATADVALRVLDGDREIAEIAATGAEVYRGPAAAAPDDAVLAERAYDALAEQVSGRLREVAEGAAGVLLARAEALRRADRPADAAEALAVYLLITSDTPTPEREAAARAFHGITGAVPALRTGYRPEVRR